MKSPDQINLGCGNRYHSAWINVDLHPAGPGVLRVDLSRKLPFEDEAFSAVYHSNVLEHIRPDQAEAFMWECARICRPEGFLRVAVPDLEQICRIYLAKLEEAIQGRPGAGEEYRWMLMEMLDQMTRETSGGQMGEYLKTLSGPNEEFVFSRIGNEGRDFVRQHRHSVPSGSDRQEHWWKRWQRKCLPHRIQVRRQAGSIGRFRLAGEVHHWMYDRFSLKEMMARAGFSELRVMLPGESRIPGWQGFHLEIGRDGSVHKPDSLIMEGIKRHA